MKYRPLLRYFGGKSRISTWVVEHFPKHKIYTEVFGGAASCLIRKERSYAEVYNDLDGEIVNLFQTVRDAGAELKRRIELTPFSRQELNEAYESTEDKIEKARRTIVKSFMSFGSDGIYRQSGFRGNTTRSYTIPAHDWSSYPKVLEIIIKRLQGVVIESMDAVDVLKKYDSRDALHYVDPPYLPDTRMKGHGYIHEMTTLDHVALASTLHGLRGGVVLSGYPSALYDDLYKGWTRVEREAYACQARKRTEVLWIKERQR